MCRKKTDACETNQEIVLFQISLIIVYILGTKGFAHIYTLI